MGSRRAAADYYPDAPGKIYASHPEPVNGLDVPANIELAERYGVDGVVTLGTDQAVVTMAAVAEAVGLPCHLTPANALRATDKSVMAAAYAAHDVPRPRCSSNARSVHHRRGPRGSRSP